jgi:coenzyme PQQ synthesis protein D (PqqD)
MRIVPVARSAELVVDSVGDELLVYDMRNSRAHSLNTVAAAVWRACDGERDLGAIAAETGFAREVVELALDNLAELELISGHHSGGISRRTVLRKLSVGAAGLAIALPVMRSITAPTAAMAAGYGCTKYRTDKCTGQSCCDSDGDAGFCDGSSNCSALRTPPVPGGNCFFNASCLFGSACNSSSTCEPI